VDSAKARIADLNSSINVTTYNTRLSSENVMEIFADYDIIVDGTDNFPTRYLASDACVLLKKPYIYGCILRFEGQASVFDSRTGPCYRCLYPAPPPPGLVPSCAEGGVIGILPGIVGLIQANEVIKLVLGVGDSLVGRLLLFDALKMKFREMKLRKDPECPICGDNPTITELIDYEQFCGIVPVQEQDSAADLEKEIAVEQVKQMMDEKHAFKLIDVREPSEYGICKIEGATLIPLGDIEAKDTALLNGLSPDDEIVLHCKAGVRSMKALKALEEMGFSNLKSMRGGINEWSEKIDSSVPLY